MIFLWFKCFFMCFLYGSYYPHTLRSRVAFRMQAFFSTSQIQWGFYKGILVKHIQRCKEVDPKWGNGQMVLE